MVIVGVNGSGKSSAVNLLTRLYDPAEGEILLDNQPLPSYKLDDVRRCTALLCQDHPIFPMSLGDNVALGLAERSVTSAQIQEAVRQGGAAHFIYKREAGLGTILSPNDGTCLCGRGAAGTVCEELFAIQDERGKVSSLSGGETQRLSA